jgi:ketosteroid isomerase-like protein
MPPNHPMVKGRAAIEQYYTKQFGGSAKLQSLALTKIESNASGDIGYEVGTYRQTITDGQHPINDAGKYAVVMKRVGGVWKVAYAIYNSDTPPTAMPTPNP